MGYYIDKKLYDYLINHGASGDYLFVEDGQYFFSGDWEEYGLTEMDGGVYTISTKASQNGILIGNLIDE